IETDRRNPRPPTKHRIERRTGSGVTCGEKSAACGVTTNFEVTPRAVASRVPSRRSPLDPVFLTPGGGPFQSEPLARARRTLDDRPEPVRVFLRAEPREVGAPLIRRLMVVIELAHRFGALGLRVPAPDRAGNGKDDRHAALCEDEDVVDRSWRRRG